MIEMTNLFEKFHNAEKVVYFPDQKLKKLDRIKVGDIISFKVLIAWRTEYGTRTVHDVDSTRRIVRVSFNGIRDRFVVGYYEITKINGEEV